MAFVDQLTFEASAGKGGDGVVRWRHEKYREFSGPSGGDGGKGGDVYALGVRDVMQLSKYRRGEVFKAEPGAPGGKNSLHGKNGADCEIKVPVGSVITNLDTGSEYEVLKEGERILLLKGGRGGFGNEHFKSSRNQTPQESTPGALPDQAKYQVELRLFADAGFVGFPNAGKSSLLNTLTNATSKVGNYEFTTLDPSLGAFHGYILADIPGLIEGASEGRGLGHKFLRHVSRTKLILHCVSFESEDLVEAYRTIRNELDSYGHGLSEKQEIVLLTKTDLAQNQTDIEQALQTLIEATAAPVYPVSIIDDEAIGNFATELSRALKDS